MFRTEILHRIDTEEQAYREADFIARTNGWTVIKVTPRQMQVTDPKTESTYPIEVWEADFEIPVHKPAAPSATPKYTQSK